MIRCDQNKFNRVLYILYPGDYFASCENCIIGTVTGSCVAVCLYDQIKGIGGMGHFIIKQEPCQCVEMKVARHRAQGPG